MKFWEWAPRRPWLLLAASALLNAVLAILLLAGSRVNEVTQDYLRLITWPIALVLLAIIFRPGFDRILTSLSGLTGAKVAGVELTFERQRDQNFLRITEAILETQRSGLITEKQAEELSRRVGLIWEQSK